MDQPELHPRGIFALDPMRRKTWLGEASKKTLSPVLRAEPRAASSRSTKCHRGTSCHTGPTQERQHVCGLFLGRGWGVEALISLICRTRTVAVLMPRSC